MTTLNAPMARDLPSSVWTGSFMIVWGGLAASYLNTGGRYSYSDMDGDGAGDLIDCASTNATAFAAPVEVAGLDITQISGGYRIAWTDQRPTTGSGTGYDLFWGAVSGLLPSGNFALGSCRSDSQAASFFDDLGPNPPPGGGYYFMVRAQNACPGGTATYGTANRDTKAAQSAARCN